MADTETTEASGTTEAEQPTQSITTLEELTASFVERVEEDSDAKEESEVEPGPETTTADADTDQKDVLLQSTETEESEEETEELAEGEEETEEEAEPQSKAVGKLLKQVNRLTARSKSSEELVETLKAEIASLKSNPQKQAESPQQPLLDDINDFKALEGLRKEALAAKKWALQHIGKDYIEDGGKEYTDDDIRNILTRAEDYLTEKIPERAQYLQDSAQWQQDTLNTHPWVSNSDSSDLAESRRGIFNDIKGQYAKVLNSLPNGDFVAATLVRGIEAIKADQAAKAAKPKAKKVAKAPPPTMGDSSPPVQTSTTRKTANRQKILERKRLSEQDLAAFLAE